MSRQTCHKSGRPSSFSIGDGSKRYLHTWRVEKLHQRIRRARENAGLSQAELASRMKVTRAAVSLWESEDDDRRTVPRMPRLEQIASITGKSLEFFLSREPASQPENAREQFEYYLSRLSSKDRGELVRLVGSSVTPSARLHLAQILIESARKEIQQDSEP